MAGYKAMPRIDVPRIERELLKALDDTVSGGKRTLEVLTDPWEHDVNFLQNKATVSGGDAKASVETKDDPFYFLDQGTKVRYAVMSKGFQPKTTVRSFKSGKGRGHFVGVNKIPKPGIEAREWTKMLSQMMGNTLAIKVGQITAGIHSKRPGVSGRRISTYTFGDKTYANK